LDNIWAYAENHAVKSDFSMTFEKVAAENATDFGGTVRLIDRERTIRSFKECIKALGLEHTQGKSAPSPTIADLMKKLEGQYPLTYDDEVQLQRLGKFKRGLHDFREPFGKNLLRENLRQMFAEYDCELKEKMVDEIHSGEVFRKFVKDFLENADPESKTLSESFATGLRGVLKGLVREAMSKRFNQLAAELNERLGEDVLPTADKLEAYVKKGETDPLPRIYKLLTNYSRCEKLGLGWLHAKPNLVLTNAVLQVINWPSANFNKREMTKIAGTIAKSDTFKESLRKLLLDGPSKGLSNFADLVTKWLGGERVLNLAKMGLRAVLDDKQPKHPLIRRCVETESPSVNQFKSLMNVYNTLALEDKCSIQEGKKAQNAEILAMIEMYLFGVVETNKGNVVLWLNRQNP